MRIKKLYMLIPIALIVGAMAFGCGKKNTGFEESTTKSESKTVTKAPPLPENTDNTPDSSVIHNLPAGNIFIECNATNGLTYDITRMYSTGSKNYFFLPAYADSNNLTVWETVDGDIKIDGRGNTSWNAGSLFGKYPYNIKLSEAANVLGLAENKKWCLIAQVFDESLIRNYIMNELGRLENLEYTPNAQNVDVYYNNEYIGTYLLSQRVNVGKNSLVKIYDLEKENEKANEGVNLDKLNRKSVGGDINGCEYGSYKYCEVPNDPADISYGYLIEFELNERYAAEKCGFVTSRGQPVIIKCPEVCSKAEVEYIRDYVQRVEDAVYSSDGKNSNNEHYSSLIDVDSFTKVYLINEISMNLDATATSFFMYLDKNSLLKAGPIWDFDWALGSYQSRDGIDLTKGTGWYVRNKKIYGNNQKDLIATLCSHDDFWDNVKTVWNSSMSGNLQTIINNIDSYGSFYSDTAAMNFTRFNILRHKPEWGSADTGITYDANIKYLKNYLERRLNFINP